MQGISKGPSGGRQGGQAIVETALTLPILFAMIYGIFGFGQIFSTQLTLVNASREGARLGALGHPQADIQATVANYLSNAGIASTLATVNVTGAQQPSGQQVAVQIVYPIALAMTIPGLPNPLPLASQAIMRIE